VAAIVAGSVAALGALGGFLAWHSIYRTVPSPEEAGQSPRDHFLYASIGTEGDEGVPYWLWLVLPTVFPEYLPGPGGYASLGVSWEPGRELPTGFTKRVVGVERIGLNCALCHVSQVRLTPDQPEATLYPGGPSHQFWPQAYQEFLFSSASDPRFNSDVIMPVIHRLVKLSSREDFLYRYIFIPASRSAMLQQKQEFAWQHTHNRPPHGPGRVDPFNPMRFRVFKEADDGSIGNSDIPAIWNQAAKTRGYLHWDGLSRQLAEVAISSAIGDGARDSYLDTKSLDAVEDFLMSLPPPKFPLPIDASLAATGSRLYRSLCADCHAPDGAKTGSVTPTSQIGTDPHRTDAWTQSQVEDWKKLAAEYQSRYGAKWNLNTFSKPGGYVTGLLDGIWLRGPYLHNGSVPSLRSLLDAPEDRPRVFYRGYDLLDAKDVGFVSNVPEARGRKFFRYDTSLPGNGNQGHVYGTNLTSAEKDALVEYMKTL
jgi:hypothetical protein